MAQHVLTSQLSKSVGLLAERCDELAARCLQTPWLPTGDSVRGASFEHTATTE
jgi:hypothetical protein